MEAGNEIRVNWWFRLGGAVLILTALVSFFAGFYRTKFYRLTGDAVWIWPQHRLASGDPIAFFATKDFVVPPNPPFVRIKVAADPEYTLYFNGVAIGGGVAGREVTLDTYEVGALARQGVQNRIVIAVRSSNGVGGLLAAVDFAPMRENDVVTDQSWTIYSRWTDEILTRTPASIRPVPIQILGRPPVGRWNYVSAARREIRPSKRDVVEAISSEPVRVPIRRIEIVGGIAVASAPLEQATAFEFEKVRGSARIEVPEGRESLAPRVVRIRYAFDRGELSREGDVRSLVVAPGEHEVIDPSSHLLRYVAVFDATARVSVVRDPTPEPKPDDEDDAGSPR